MTKVSVCLDSPLGPIKPMHAVNNGPVGARGCSNAHLFTEAHIPYARNHDASFCSSYGGEFSVDVHRIFRDFSADPYDPASYSFISTDKCVERTFDAGVEVFYRLGAAIEHGEKRGTYPPADYKKWAVICEHIIRHYTEGWADGFTYPIRYWEVWNEPDCKNANGSNPCWQGTWEEFLDFFSVAVKHLKATFPHLRIGGPALCSVWKEENVKILFAGMRERNIPLDFFSYHWYGRNPADLAATICRAKELCVAYGYGDVELILNEWNYIRGWAGENMAHSKRLMRDERGAAFIASIMSVGQAEEVDMLMYYDARPCSFNGLFDAFLYDPFKPYFALRTFGELYVLGTEVAIKGLPEGVYATAAKGDGGYAVMLSYFDEAEGALPRDIELTVQGVPSDARLAAWVIDSDRCYERLCEGSASSLSLSLSPNSVIVIKSL